MSLDRGAPVRLACKERDVNCPRCQRATPPDADFCPECGARLALDCPRCGTVNAADHKFCKKCGQALGSTAALAESRFASPHTYTPKHLAEKILVSRASLEGERKQVTVLFVDVSGFTALSEKLDPEDVHQLMDQAFEAMLAEVQFYAFKGRCHLPTATATAELAGVIRNFVRTGRP
jgi:RNA polymerase subunit RPABC4/transcription elongation factor Spt4